MGKKTKVPTKVAKAAERKIDPALMGGARGRGPRGEGDGRVGQAHLEVSALQTLPGCLHN